MTEEDIEALNRFIEKYPTWWWRIGWCNFSRDFDCAPQADSPEAAWIEIDNIWDNGFTCDHFGSIADAINDVMRQIKEATPSTKESE